MKAILQPRRMPSYKHFGSLDIRSLQKRVPFIQDWIYRTDIESYKTCTISPDSSEWPEDEINDVLKRAEIYFPSGYQNRVLLSCVPSGASILPHTDDFGVKVHMSSLHCHIPIITHESVVMGIGEDVIHMKSGNLYTMDVTQIHYVNNPSSIDRVHLLFAHFQHK